MLTWRTTGYARTVIQRVACTTLHDKQQSNQQPNITPPKAPWSLCGDCRQGEDLGGEGRGGGGMRGGGIGGGREELTEKWGVVNAAMGREFEVGFWLLLGPGTRQLTLLRH